MANDDERDSRTDGADATSIGLYLASQRKLRGISLDDLSASTKIPRRNLERLESGAFDGQLDGFVRGFVRTVAEALGLDPREAVMRLVREPTASDEEARRRRRIRAAVIGGLAGAALLLLFGWGLRVVTRWIVEPAGGPPDFVYRRDAVRSLIESGADTVAAEPAESAGGEAPAEESEAAGPPPRAEDPSEARVAPVAPGP